MRTVDDSCGSAADDQICNPFFVNNYYPCSCATDMLADMKAKVF